jgi:hypothetical protein
VHEGDRGEGARSVIRIIDCEQGTPEWHAARGGIPTASRFQDILTRGRGAAPGKVRRTYMLELLGERLLGDQVPEGFTGNRHTERGHAFEQEARDLYAFQTGLAPQRVGFIRNDALRAGASPDSLVGPEGGLEVKTKLPGLHLAVLLDDVIPDEHVAQVQGSMLITGRSWWDFVSYCPGLPLFRKRALRNEGYIAALRIEISDFNDELDALEAKLK